MFIIWIFSLDTFPFLFWLKEKELEEGRVIMMKLADLTCRLGKFFWALFSNRVRGSLYGVLIRCSAFWDLGLSTSGILDRRGLGDWHDAFDGFWFNCRISVSLFRASGALISRCTWHWPHFLFWLAVSK